MLLTNKESPEKRFSQHKRLAQHVTRRQEVAGHGAIEEPDEVLAIKNEEVSKNKVRLTQ